MKNRSLVIGALLGVFPLTSSSQAVDYVDAKPLSVVVKQGVQACGVTRELRVPFIAWGGDMATIYGNGNAEATAQGSIFQKKGLNLKLYREDRFVSQVEDYLACKTPFLRGTLGMIAMANDVINTDSHTKPVAIYQHTWSEGGDVLVCRDSVKEPKDLAGKTVALQAYGPHVDYLTTVLKSAGIPLNQVQLKWVRDITENAKDKSSVFPAKALREDKSVDCAFVISPDANALTSGGKVGTGAEESVKGARALLSTKTASRVIADVYVVRQDFYDANKQLVENFVHGLMLAQEASADLVGKKTAQKRAYDDFIKASARMLLDSPDATADAEGMWGDANFVGWKGNVPFFTDINYPRSFAKLTSEVGEAFGPAGLKLIAKPVYLTPAAFDYVKLGDGIREKGGVEVSRFNKEAVDKLVRERQQMGRLDEGQQFHFDIYFKPRVTDFPTDLYGEKFDQFIDFSSTYGGAVITIEGNVDPQDYLRRKAAAIKCEQSQSGPAVDECKARAGATALALTNMRQGAKNDSLRRANAARDAIIAYSKGKGISLDPNQIATVGNGFMKPNVHGCTYERDGDIAFTCYPKSEDAWNQTRRAKVGVISVETESEVFQPFDAPVASKK